MWSMQKQLTSIVNGHLNGTISPLDRGLAYGDGIFRTIKVVNGLPEQWPAHYQKLVADCGVIGIVCPSAELLMSDWQQLFSADEHAVAKIMITRGEGERGYKPPAVTAPVRVLLKLASTTYAETNFTEGVHLHLCDTRLAAQPKLAGIKHLNRLENVLARMEWHNPDIADGLMLDFQNNVIECTSANIFARFGDALITPSLDSCGIAGITRQRIVELAYTLALNPIIETFNLKKLLSADEVIICSSLYGAWQVRSIADHHWQKSTLAANIRLALNA